MKLLLVTWGLMAVFFQQVPIERRAPLDLYPDEAIEALIAVESCGQPFAVGGSMRGLLQMSPIYLKDASTPIYNAFIPHEAVAVFDSMMLRYNVRLPQEPEIAIAVFHKGGPGVHKRWRRRVRRGENPVVAAQKAADATGIKGMKSFLSKYQAARAGRAYWCGPQWRPRKLRETFGS